jgi:Sulfotransferase domain
VAFDIKLKYFDDTLTGSTVPNVERGRTICAGGWAADVERGTGARRISGLVDGVYRVDARAIVNRELAETTQSTELLNTGFEVEIPSEFLTLGTHELQVVAETPDGTVYRSPVFAFTVSPAEAGGKRPRLVIAAAPKSGSTYVQFVLREYFGTTNHPRGRHYHPGWEYNIDTSLVDRLRGRSFILQLHLRPYPQNLAVLQAENINAIVTWRNLGDVLVSLDDYICQHGLPKNSFTFLFNFLFYDDPAYVAMPEQKRYQFLIRHSLGWWVSFYVGWKKQRVPFFHYELLASDPMRYFSEVITAIDGNPDVERLSEVLSKPMTYGNSKLNVGRNGRSIEKLSDGTKAMLEDFLNEHFEPLDDLVAELPWKKGETSG